MSPKAEYLAVAILGAVGLLSFSLPAAPELVRTVLGVPLAVLLPGLALTGALLPERSLGAPARSMLAVALSLILLVVAALVLHLSPWGVRPAPWGLIVSGTTFLFAMVAAFRMSLPGSQDDAEREALDVQRRLGIDPPDDRSPAQEPRLARPVAMFALAGIIVAGAAGVAVWGATAQPAAAFTELWLLPYPDSDDVTVGVRNLEDGARSYRLELLGDDRRIARWTIADLAPGETWSQRLALTPGSRARVEARARLYLASDPAMPYREVRLWRGQPATTPRRAP